MGKINDISRADVGIPVTDLTRRVVDDDSVNKSYLDYGVGSYSAGSYDAEASEEINQLRDETLQSIMDCDSSALGLLIKVYNGISRIGSHFSSRCRGGSAKFIYKEGMRFPGPDVVSAPYRDLPGSGSRFQGKRGEVQAVDINNWLVVEDPDFEIDEPRMVAIDSIVADYKKLTIKAMDQLDCWKANAPTFSGHRTFIK